MNARFLTVIVLVAGMAAFAQEAQTEKIIPASSEWKWLHPANGEAPAVSEPDFNKSFMQPGYDDSKWLSGADSDAEGGGFGYGDATSVVWPTPTNPDHRKTGYLRHKFITKKAMTGLVLSCQRDDGVIVYLDGREVARNNVGEGADTWDLMASATVGGEAEKQRVEIKLAGEKLPPGAHVLAISLHNRAGGGSDLRIAGITLFGQSVP